MKSSNVSGQIKKANSARPRRIRSGKAHRKPRLKSLIKCPTGIRGFDEIIGGGLPAGRPTLVCGSAGCGKTLFANEFIIHGITRYNEPGLFVAFEETAADLATNVASLGFDLETLVAAHKLVIDHVYVDPHEILETGEYDLEGLFIRLGHAIDSIQAKRVVLDTIETLFSGLPNPGILRSELRRLFKWLKEKGVTAVVTAERGDGQLTRHGIEEYVSDCVIVLDHPMRDQIATRRVRVAKYRGSSHGTNDYPFLIDERGICVLPVTSVGLTHPASTERIASGIPRLDAMLGGQGYFRGTSILVCGTAGCGKTSVSAHFIDASCRRGERCLHFLFEESPEQLIRNMRSIGINLERWSKNGRLRFSAARPSLYGLELHLANMIKAVAEFNPSVVVIDPISSFVSNQNQNEVKTMLIRLIDYLKVHQITALLVSLTSGHTDLETTDSEISSLIDTWILLRDIEVNGERNRGMYILKSRGMAHSNQIREFVLTNRGAVLKDVYIGQGNVLTGSARLAQEAREEQERLAAKQEVERHRQALERKRRVMESQIAAIRAEFAADEIQTQRILDQARIREQQLGKEREMMARSRACDHLANR